VAIAAGVAYCGRNNSESALSNAWVVVVVFQNLLMVVLFQASFYGDKILARKQRRNDC
jgi:hypothetical protein